MNIPSIPTDNLYKFIALSGTILVLLTGYIAETRVSEVEDAILEANETLRIIKTKSDALKLNAENIKTTIKNSISNQNGKYQKDSTKLQIEYTSNEIKELLQKIQETDLVIQIEHSKSISKTKKVEQLHERSKMIVIRSFIAMFIGIFMACFGFFFWYIRVQKPLDLILQNELYKK